MTEAILGRHSTRDHFSRTPIPDDILQNIVRCGLAAPSSKNSRPWRFHVVSDPTMLDELAMSVEAAEGAETYVPRDPATGEPRPEWPSTVAESADVLRHVATGIFVENRGPFTSGRRFQSDPIRFNLVGYCFEVLGIGAAIQNMWVSAHALGVQATYMGDVLIAEEEIARRLGIERDLVGVLALGYSEARAPRRVSRDISDPATVVWHNRMTPSQPTR